MGNMKVESGSETFECKIGHCREHQVNSYRIEELEKAQNELCIAKKDLYEKQGKNTTIMKVVGLILSVSFVSITGMTWTGWDKLSDFTEKMYSLRESDHVLMETFKLGVKKTDVEQAYIIKEHSKLLLDHEECIETLKEDVRGM